jgi:hypothetical protein
MIKANPKDAVIRRQIESVEFGYVTFFYLFPLWGAILRSFLELIGVDSFGASRGNRSTCWTASLLSSSITTVVSLSLCDPFLDSLVASTPRR